MYVKKIFKALVGKKADYENLRKRIISEKGYDYFRSEQKKAFKMLNARPR